MADNTPTPELVEKVARALCDAADWPHPRYQTHFENAALAALRIAGEWAAEKCDWAARNCRDRKSVV